MYETKLILLFPYVGVCTIVVLLDRIVFLLRFCRYIDKY